MIKMKNILAENLLRFGVKNLNESDKKVLSEALLLEQTQQVTNALNTLNDSLKNKATIIKAAKVYPIISLRFSTNVLPQKGQKMGKVGGEMPGIIDPQYEDRVYGGNLAAGSKMPLGLTVSMGLDDIQKVTNPNYAEYLKDMKLRTKKSWVFPYNSGAGEHHGHFPRKWEDATQRVISYLDNYYVTDNNGKWFGTNEVFPTISATSQDFYEQVKTLMGQIALYPFEPLSF